ncbi:ketosteroid isomerase [Streptomyces albus subsp. albus]|nr:ketosteroid isomerase [Streptomyces albus subsp. albus]
MSGSTISGGRTATERTRAVIEDYLSRAATRDPEHIAAVYAERVDWHVAPNPTVPWIRARSTREDVAGHWRDLDAYTIPERAEVTLDAFLVDGADAVLTGHLSGTVRATGKVFHSPFALRLTVEDGLIVRHHVYEDGLAVAAACAPDA